jgi:hypothetical protein
VPGTPAGRRYCPQFLCRCSSQEKSRKLRFNRVTRPRIPLVACSFDPAAPFRTWLPRIWGIRGNLFRLGWPASMVITNERSHPRFVIGKILDDGSGKHHREFIVEALGIGARTRNDIRFAAFVKMAVAVSRLRLSIACVAIAIARLNFLVSERMDSKSPM